jgi:hypothetical protein
MPTGLRRRNSEVLVYMKRRPTPRMPRRPVDAALCRSSSASAPRPLTRPRRLAPVRHLDSVLRACRRPQRPLPVDTA